VDNQWAYLSHGSTFPDMQKIKENKSQSRLIIATALFALSILASFLISYTSNLGDQYWVLLHPVARGVQISNGDVALVKAKLDPNMKGYLRDFDNPIGSVTTRNVTAGRFLSLEDISENVALLQSENVSISLRASDIPGSVRVGDLISLFQVHDARNGEPTIEPMRVLSGAYVFEISRKSANFASDLSVTLTLNRDDVPLLLSATSSGRLVVVSSHG
jgi:hypothetical protein